MLKKKKAKTARQAMPFHLADLVGALWRLTREDIRGYRPKESGAEKFPKGTVHDEPARTYVHNVLTKHGGISDEQFTAYARVAGAACGIYAIGKSVVLPGDEDASDKAAFARCAAVPPGGNHGQPAVCSAIARLHDEGWTRLLLADIWERWPALAEGRGLPRPEKVKQTPTTTELTYLNTDVRPQSSSDEDFFAKVSDEVHGLFFPPAPEGNMAVLRERIDYAIERHRVREAEAEKEAAAECVQLILKHPELQNEAAGPPDNRSIWTWEKLTDPKTGDVVEGWLHERVRHAQWHSIFYADTPEERLPCRYLEIAMVHDWTDDHFQRARPKLLEGFDLPEEIAGENAWWADYLLGTYCPGVLPSEASDQRRRQIERALADVKADLHARQAAAAESQGARAENAPENGRNRGIWSHQHCPSCGHYQVEFLSAKKFSEKPDSPCRNTVNARVREGKYWSDVGGRVPWCPVCKARTPEGPGVSGPNGAPIVVTPGTEPYKPSQEDQELMLAWARGVVENTPGCELPPDNRSPLKSDPPAVLLGLDRLSDAVSAIYGLGESLGRLPPRDEAEAAAAKAIANARNQDVRASHQTDAYAKLRVGREEQRSNDADSEEG